MFGRMKRDRVLVLCAGERRSLTMAMLSFRNKLLAGGKPTEDVNELQIRLIWYRGAHYLLCKGKTKAAAELGLSFLAYNLTRAINLLGVNALIAAM